MGIICLLLPPRPLEGGNGLGRCKVYDLIRSGRLESVKVGRDRRIPVDAIDDFIDQLRKNAA